MKGDPSLHEKLRFKTSDGYYFELRRNIVYFKSDGDFTFIHLFGEEKPVKIICCISEINQELAGYDSFFMCHRSYIVNFEHVHRFCPKAKILVTTAGAIPIAEGRMKEFRDRFCR